MFAVIMKGVRNSPGWKDRDNSPSICSSRRPATWIAAPGGKAKDSVLFIVLEGKFVVHNERIMVENEAEQAAMFQVVLFNMTVPQCVQSRKGHCADNGHKYLCNNIRDTCADIVPKSRDVDKPCKAVKYKAYKDGKAACPL